MNILRRQFLQFTLAAAAFGGLRKYVSTQSIGTGEPTMGYGPLQMDPSHILDLPSGFSYQVISQTGESMTDGLLVPGAHDGMAAFAGPRGKTVLVRNHELSADSFAIGPFGASNQLLSRLSVEKVYDGAPALGGTTTLLYDTRQRKLESHFLSLAGTIRNCAGGVTPWGSWITCEETSQRADAIHKKDHGFNFEIPAKATRLVEPVPLKAMGRFNHEAIAVDANSGVVYQTEDRGDGLLYRFVPTRHNQLAAGGRLQALKIRELADVDTSNWQGQTVPVGKRFDADWIDLQDVESPADDLRMQGASKGAARFSRGEGMWAGRGVIYFACTSGGSAKAGQIWRYIPSQFEGDAKETQTAGKLELFVEPNDNTLLENADTITVSPWADLIVCEDGPGENNVVGVTPRGDVYHLARNAMNMSEFAGATFSPDGTTLFLNIQTPGLTLAITGPWKKPQS